MTVGLERRDIIKGLAGGAAGLILGSRQAVARQVTDYTGEMVEITSNPSRLLLGDGHLLLALALVHPEPASLIAAWQGDLVQHSTGIYEAYLERNPKLAEVPLVGRASADSFSVEAAIAARPDLAILAGCYGPGKDTPQVVGALRAAGIPILFVDFFLDPIRNTAAGIRSIGQALGTEAAKRGEEFASFHEKRLNRIRQRLSASNRRPSVLLDMSVGAWDCCWLPGSAGLARFIEFAGGKSIGAELSDFAWIKASREYVLSQTPDIFVTTGGPYLRGKGGPVLGPGISEVEARRTLGESLDNSGLEALAPVAERRAFAFWHLFQATPINIVAVEALANWLHPDIFSDIDPAATMDEINDRFFSVPLKGCFTVALQDFDGE